jgi:DNA-binding GntR family transcriptional regulator
VPENPGIVALHNRMRDMILSGELEPNSIISQVQLATDFGISRTPLREVMRMLQEEGLIIARPHRQAQVAALNLEDLEAVYMHRILLESLGISLTVQTMTPETLDAIVGALADMQTAVSSDDSQWDEAHKRFHELVVAAAPRQALTLIHRLQERATRYRLLYARLRSAEFSPRSAGMRDHEAIVAACHAGDAALASTKLAKHLGRTALTLIAEVAPEYEPLVVRTSLQLVVQSVGRPGLLEHLSANGPARTDSFNDDEGKKRASPGRWQAAGETGSSTSS